MGTKGQKESFFANGLYTRENLSPCRVISCVVMGSWPARSDSLLCVDPRTDYSFSLLHLNTHSLTSLIIFTVEKLWWTRNAVHIITPTLCYCSFVPGKKRVLNATHGMFILTDDVPVSYESREKNVGQYLKLGHVAFVQHPFQVFVHYSHQLTLYLLLAADTVVK